MAGIPALLGTKTTSINATTLTGAENEINTLLAGNGRTGPLSPGGAAGLAAAVIQDESGETEGSVFTLAQPVLGAFFTTSSSSTTSTSSTH